MTSPAPEPAAPPPPDTPPPGVQAERTDLAWQRTALALGTGSLVAGRLLTPVVGPVGWALAVAGLLCAATLWWLARRRTAAWSRRLVDDASPAPGGAVLTATAAGVLVLALAALAAVLSGRL
ncbi:hypothetical protein AGMMS50218_14090 [Actinomycetota bacterium]|nr:hypothetical protein AGMMS50218_14090 [Actinomycetota bacterium]